MPSGGGSPVAFTPKGGCPLKLRRTRRALRTAGGSIHPQGWVPFETAHLLGAGGQSVESVAFTPKGGCPLKLELRRLLPQLPTDSVAFTPKGGCPLKPGDNARQKVV